MKNMISIIITNYNYARYLRDSIDSALNQTYPVKEIIVVDDGSTDNSQEIIASYGDKIISIYSNNSGQTIAANIGFNISRGSIIVFLDSDDILLENAVETLAKPLLQDDSVAKSQGYLTVVDIEGNPIGSRIPNQFDISGDYKNCVLENGLRGRCKNTYTSGNAWSRWFLEQVFPLPEGKSIALGVDSLLNTIYALFGKVVSIDQSVANYRVHDCNIGPVSSQFTAVSLKKILAREEFSKNYLADWAIRLGFDIPSDSWGEQRLSWHRHLMAHSLDIMENTTPTQKCNQLVLSPFRTTNMYKLKAAGISVLLGIICVSPKNPALKLARRMLRM